MKRTFRVLMINDHLYFGGGGDAVFRLEREAYEAAGYEVFTFSQAHALPRDATTRDIVLRDNRSYIATKVGKFLGAPQVSSSLRRVLNHVRPDIVRVHLVAKYPAAIYPALRGYPVIQTLHVPNIFCATSWGNLRPNGLTCELGVGLKCWTRGCVSLPEVALHTALHKRVNSWIKRVVCLYHCPSLQIQNVAESLGFGPTLHIPLGIDADFVDARPASHNGPPMILYVGAIAEQKGVLLLPDLLYQVKQRIPDTRLTIAGRGSLTDRLALEFDQRGLGTCVDFRGFVDRTQMLRLYQSAHVLVMPSIWNEQFGLVGPEALACGVPCVASDVGGIPEWLHHGEWGYLVPPRDPQALAERVTSLLLDRQTRLDFGAKGRIYSLTTHSPGVYQDRWLQIATDYIATQTSRAVVG